MIVFILFCLMLFVREDLMRGFWRRLFFVYRKMQNTGHKLYMRIVDDTQTGYMGLSIP